MAVKVDQLINTVGELVIAQSMLASVPNGKLDPTETGDISLPVWGSYNANARDFKVGDVDSYDAMEYVFSRFPRLVRDLAGKLASR